MTPSKKSKKLVLHRETLKNLTPQGASAKGQQALWPDWTTITTIFSEVVSCHLQ